VSKGLTWGNLTAHGLLWRHVRHRTHHHPFSSEARPVQRHRQTEIADLGDAICREPNVARLHVPVDDPPAVGELQAPARFLGDIDGLFQEKPVTFGIFNQAFYVAANHELRDHVGLISFFAQIKDGHDMGMRTQPPHGLGFALYTLARGIVQPLGLDQGEGHVPV